MKHVTHVPSTYKKTQAMPYILKRNIGEIESVMLNGEPANK